MTGQSLHFLDLRLYFLDGKSLLFRSMSLLFRGRKLLLANAARPLVPACPGQWAAAQLLQGGAQEQAFLQFCRLAVSTTEGIYINPQL